MTELLMMCFGEGETRRAAALGQTFRALGRNLRVCVLSLGAHRADYGALESSAAFKDRFTRTCPERASAWPIIRETIMSGDYDMVILEDFGDLLQEGLVDPAEAASFLSADAVPCHVFATGDTFTDVMIHAADMVTEAAAV